MKSWVSFGVCVSWFLHCFTNTMLFLVFCNENFLHFLCIFIDLLVILDISLIYSALFAIKNNNNFIFYQILRVCVLVKHFANVSALRWNGACVCECEWWAWKCVWWISFSSRKSYRSWETWRHVNVCFIHFCVYLLLF